MLRVGMSQTHVVKNLECFIERRPMNVEPLPNLREYIYMVGIA